jgi:hypothetical protein
MMTYETLTLKSRQNIDTAVWAVNSCAPANREDGIAKIRTAFRDAFGESAAAVLIHILRDRLAMLHTHTAGNA